VREDSSEGSQIWALDERHSWLHRRNSEPIQLTTGATYWGGIQDADSADEGNLAIARDGSKVFSTGSTLRGELLIRDAKSRGLEPYLGGISAEFLDFTRDGKYLVYVTYPEGVMWKANRDGTGLMQLNSAFVPN